jgi:hypothetical protein
VGALETAALRCIVSTVTPASPVPPDYLAARCACFRRLHPDLALRQRCRCKSASDPRSLPVAAQPAFRFRVSPKLPSAWYQPASLAQEPAHRQLLHACMHAANFELPLAQEHNRWAQMPALPPVDPHRQTSNTDFQIARPAARNRASARLPT